MKRVFVAVFGLLLASQRGLRRLREKDGLPFLTERI